MLRAILPTRPDLKPKRSQMSMEVDRIRNVAKKGQRFGTYRCTCGFEHPWFISDGRIVLFGGAESEH